MGEVRLFLLAKKVARGIGLKMKNTNKPRTMSFHEAFLLLGGEDKNHRKDFI